MGAVEVKAIDGPLAPVDDHRLEDIGDAVIDHHRALRHGMPGGRYIFSTSNCIYTGMRLERYELILDVWRREGNYAGAGRC